MDSPLRLTDVDAQALLGSPFALCPTCGALTSARVYHHRGERGDGPYWERLTTPLTPILGYAHLCEINVHTLKNTP